MHLSFLNGSAWKDFEFLYDMFAANLYDAVFGLVESEETTEKILTDTFVSLRQQVFAYHQDYESIFIMLLGIALKFSYNQFANGNAKQALYKKLKQNMHPTGIAYTRQEPL